MHLEMQLLSLMVKTYISPLQELVIRVTLVLREPKELLVFRVFRVFLVVPVQMVLREHKVSREHRVFRDLMVLS